MTAVTGRNPDSDTEESQTGENKNFSGSQKLSRRAERRPEPEFCSVPGLMVVVVVVMLVLMVGDGDGGGGG